MKIPTKPLTLEDLISMFIKDFSPTIDPVAKARFSLRLRHLLETFAEATMQHGSLPDNEHLHNSHPKVEEWKREGWDECLHALLSSLEGYPNAGGDEEIMRQVDRIVAEAVKKSTIKPVVQ